MTEQQTTQPNPDDKVSTMRMHKSTKQLVNSLRVKDETYEGTVKRVFEETLKNYEQVQE